MSEKKDESSLKVANINVDLGDIESVEDSVESLAYKQPDMLTRLFYAQRYIEKQYDEVSHERGLNRKWNNLIMKSLKIANLEPKTNDYPTWNNSDLASRNSHWFVCAGLLTSEIMGAYLVPNSVAMLGYAPSNVMLSICFILTLVAGVVIWWMFLLLDSPEYPIRTFADIAYLLGGEVARQSVIFLQVIAMVLTAATAVISCTESVIILRTERVCWVGLLVLIVGVQGILGHVKTLSNLGKYCVLVSICNYVNLYVQLGYIGGTEPNWENAKNILGLDKGPIQTVGIVLGQTLVNRVVAVSNISYVFAGSVVFPEIISELRRPWDFWKSMICSQCLIFGTYMIYGNFIYSNQGQFANSPAVFGISDNKALKGLSFITFLTGFIQAIFYGNLTCKIAYKNYMSLIFKGLKIKSKKGLLVWSGTTIFIWACTFIISAGVPQVSAVSSFTSALTMIPLTYAIPFIFHMLTLFIKTNVESIEGYDPSSPGTFEEISKKTFFARGFKKSWSISVFYICLSLAALSFSGLGLYGSVEYMKVIFATTPATSFSCTSPI